MGQLHKKSKVAAAVVLLLNVDDDWYQWWWHSTDIQAMPLSLGNLFITPTDIVQWCVYCEWHFSLQQQGNIFASEESGQCDLNLNQPLQILAVTAASAPPFVCKNFGLISFD